MSDDNPISRSVDAMDRVSEVEEAVADATKSLRAENARLHAIMDKLRGHVLWCVKKSHITQSRGAELLGVSLVDFRTIAAKENNDE